MTLFERFMIAEKKNDTFSANLFKEFCFVIHQDESTFISTHGILEEDDEFVIVYQEHNLPLVFHKSDLQSWRSTLSEVKTRKEPNVVQLRIALIKKIGKPRKKGLTNMCESIKSIGQMQAIEVNKKYHLLDGQLRVRAMKRLGRTTIQAIIRED